MVVPYTNVRCTGGGESQEFHFDHVGIDVFVRYTNRTIEQRVEYLSRELRGMLRTENINLRVMNMVMLLKTLEIDGTHQRKRVQME